MQNIRETKRGLGGGRGSHNVPQCATINCSLPEAQMRGVTFHFHLEQEKDKEKCQNGTLHLIRQFFFKLLRTCQKASLFYKKLFDFSVLCCMEIQYIIGA